MDGNAVVKKLEPTWRAVLECTRTDVEELEKDHWSGGGRLVGWVGRRAVVGKSDFY